MYKLEIFKILKLADSAMIFQSLLLQTTLLQQTAAFQWKVYDNSTATNIKLHSYHPLWALHAIYIQDFCSFFAHFLLSQPPPT